MSRERLHWMQSSLGGTEANVTPLQNGQSTGCSIEMALLDYTIHWLTFSAMLRNLPRARTVTIIGALSAATMHVQELRCLV